MSPKMANWEPIAENRPLKGEWVMVHPDPASGLIMRVSSPESKRLDPERLVSDVQSFSYSCITIGQITELHPSLVHLVFMSSQNATTGNGMLIGHSSLLRSKFLLDLPEGYHIVPIANPIHAIPLYEGKTVSIGRDRQNCFYEPTISRHHLDISMNNGRILIEDRSSNGTKIVQYL